MSIHAFLDFVVECSLPVLREVKIILLLEVGGQYTFRIAGGKFGEWKDIVAYRYPELPRSGR